MAKMILVSDDFTEQALQRALNKVVNNQDASVDSDIMAQSSEDEEVCE